jgi:hypothetical protein
MIKNTSEQNETAMYAVFRSGIRVSDSEYDSKLDAQRELDYWARNSFSQPKESQKLT